MPFKKNVFVFIVTILVLSACVMKQERTEQVSANDSTTHAEDTVQSVGLNDIRFAGWERSDWLDNEYIRTLREYLDDYNAGKVSNPNLDPYKEQIKGKFIIYNITPFMLGGAFIQIVFLDMPDKVFGSWVYSIVNEEKGKVESYVFRSISIEEGESGFTREDILQAIKEMDGLKLW